MSDLLNRFEGEANAKRLVEIVRRQKLVGGDADLARALIDRGQLQEMATGDHLIDQGSFDDDMFFVLVGAFQILINNRKQAIREAGQHLGEQAGVDSSRPRSATVIAHEPSLVLRMSQADFEAVAQSYPDIWKRMLLTTQARLEERNRRIGAANEIPRVFVISSSEALAVANQVCLALDGKEIAVDVWDKGTFCLGEYPISSLMDAIKAADFTISIVRADDQLVSRDQTKSVARDNVHLEYGISLGLLGRRRSILLVCADDGVTLPSDAAGLTTARYRAKTADDMKRSVRNACLEIKELIDLEGVFQDRVAD